MKKFFICIIILAGFVMGVLLGDISNQFGPLSFLGFGFDFGLENPIVLNLGVMKLTLGFWMNVNLGGLAGLIISIFLSNSIMKKW